MKLFLLFEMLQFYFILVTDTFEYEKTGKTNVLSQSLLPVEMNWTAFDGHSYTIPPLWNSKDSVLVCAGP